MKRLFAARSLALVAATFAAPLAWAHTGHGVAGAVSGFGGARPPPAPVTGKEPAAAGLAGAIGAATRGGGAEAAGPFSGLSMSTLPRKQHPSSSPTRGALRLPAAQRNALEEGRLTVVSPFPETEKRATADLARQRNRFVAALADEVVFAFISPGGSLSLLAGELAGWSLEPRQLHR